MRLNASPDPKNLKIGVQNGPNSKAYLAPKRAIKQSWSANWHFSSANQPKCGTWPKGFQIEINLPFYDFLEIKTRPNSYSNHLTNFSKHSHPYKQREPFKIQETFSHSLTLLFLALLFISFLSYCHTPNPTIKIDT